MRGEAIQLTVEGDKEKADILVKEIRKNVADAEAKVKTSDITIAISGIDMATTDEEVIEALASATGEKKDNVKLRSLRPGYYDDQTAVVAMPRTSTLTMLKQGRLRVGWISCPVRERIQLQRCYRCLDFGHRSQECRGEDRSKICMKCGKTGHKAKECVGTICCTACKTEGHKADQMRCPLFRRMVEQERRARIMPQA
ncbi:hypothetical protein JTB14_038309 [Gonioctena quinquepunctata]|nr:hypothetical protein JTB14_038309 [Gonioctena quinquepunctata]